jgi:hypothetical protein
VSSGARSSPSSASPPRPTRADDITRSTGAHIAAESSAHCRTTWRGGTRRDLRCCASSIARAPHREADRRRGGGATDISSCARTKRQQQPHQQILLRRSACMILSYVGVFPPRCASAADRRIRPRRRLTPLARIHIRRAIEAPPDACAPSPAASRWSPTPHRCSTSSCVASSSCGAIRIRPTHSRRHAHI